MKTRDLHIPPVRPSSSVRGRRILRGGHGRHEEEQRYSHSSNDQDVQEFKRPESRGRCLCLCLAKPNGRP